MTSLTNSPLKCCKSCPTYHQLLHLKNLWKFFSFSKKENYAHDFLQLHTLCFRCCIAHFFSARCRNLETLFGMENKFSNVQMVNDFPGGQWRNRRGFLRFSLIFLVQYRWLKKSSKLFIKISRYFSLKIVCLKMHLVILIASHSIIISCYYKVNIMLLCITTNLSAFLHSTQRCTLNFKYWSLYMLDDSCFSRH